VAYGRLFLFFSFANYLARGSLSVESVLVISVWWMPGFGRQSSRGEIFEKAVFRKRYRQSCPGESPEESRKARL